MERILKQKPVPTHIIAGSSMLKAYTINSMYADGKIELLSEVDGSRYRIDVSELLKLVQREKFIATKKAKYYHLTLLEN